MKKSFLATGAFLGATAVMFGAFGAHQLSELIAENDLKTFHTGVQYQFYHALALILTAIIYPTCQQKLANATGYLFMAGVILFSGSLYLISLSSVLQLESVKWLGPITPIGGLCLVIGWLSLLASIMWRK